MNRRLRRSRLDEALKLALVQTLRAFHRSSHVASKQTGWSYWHNPGKEALKAITVGNLVDESADKFGDVEAVVSHVQNKRLTYHEAKTKIDQLAAGFMSLGLKPGDRVGLLEPNSEEWYISFLAGAKAGLLIMTINPSNSPSEIAHCLRLTNARALISTDTFKNQNTYEDVVSIMPEIGKTSSGSPVRAKDFPHFEFLITTSDRTIPGAFRLQDVFSLANKESINLVNKLQTQIQPDDGFNLQFTSGTTGNPKAALLSHFNLINNSYNIARRFQYDKKRYKLCCSAPLFHVYGTVAAILGGLHFGSTIVLPSLSYSSKRSAEAIAKEQCNVLYGTPTMHIDLMSVVEENSDLKSKMNLEKIVTAGSLLLPQVYDKLKQTFPSAEIDSLYGMTETSPSSFQTLPTASNDQRKHTVGYVHEHVEVKVVDRSGKLVPFGSPGELWVRGYLNMLGYYNQDSKTTELIRKDGWLKTGDEVILSEDGHAQIVGRIKDIIIRGGENIPPKEVEDYLTTHPDIFEVAVFGVTDERMGEEVSAEIILKPGKTLTADDVKSFCKGKISPFKIPKYIQFAEEFPKTGSGKIKKHVLRQRLEETLKENKN